MKTICGRLAVAGLLGLSAAAAHAQQDGSFQPQPYASPAGGPAVMRLTDEPDATALAAIPVSSWVEEVPADGVAPPNPYLGDAASRPVLSGDWGGTRSALLERGVNFDLFATQFYQGVASGGRSQEFEYGGKLDLLMNLDGDKLAGWKGGFVDFHVESRLGQDANSIDGLLAPVNLPMLFPEPGENIVALTGFKVTQALSENFALYAGKINTLDEFPLRYSPGIGTNKPGLAGFMNTSLVFNPIAARTLTYSAAGIGFAVLRDLKPLFSFSVFDPQERAIEGLDDLYETGVVMVPDLILRGQPFGLPALLNIGGTYSNAEYRSFDPSAYLNLPLTQFLPGPRETDSWSLYTNFYQALWADPCDSQRSWGLFGLFGISDGNPNPVGFTANGGIGGRSPLPGRGLDTFGLGFFYLGFSDEFKTLSSALIPQQDEYGVEVFYNRAITPWARLTGDLQVARPSTIGLDTAIVPGLRLQIIY